MSIETYRILALTLTLLVFSYVGWELQKGLREWRRARKKRRAELDLLRTVKMARQAGAVAVAVDPERAARIALPAKRSREAA